MAVSKEDAQKAYHERKVRKLYAIEGHEAKKHFVQGDRLAEALNQATDVRKVFITFDGDSFGVYELLTR